MSDNVFSRIADLLELDFRQVVVAIIGVLLTIAILGVIAYIRFGIWQLQHPNAPWWSWLM